MSRPSGWLIAGAAAWTGSVLAALEYLAPSSWAGLDDWAGMTVWSVPLAALVSLLDFLLQKTASIRPLARFAAAALLGPILGLACFLTAAALLGGWKVAFPVYICWAFGATLGLIAGAWAAHPRLWGIAVALAAAAVLAMLWANASASAAESRSRSGRNFSPLKTCIAELQGNAVLAKRF